ncbi:MAG: dockerin type I repeat-containing protein [bacterium]
MNREKLWLREISLLALLLLLVYGEARAQFQLHCDAVSSVGSFSSASSFILLATAGQAHPTETASSVNQILRPGFIPCLLFVQPTDCRVTARVELPSDVLENRQFTAEIFVDMRICAPPDDRLGSFSSSLSWNTSLLRFVNHSGVLAGFTGVVNTANANSGALDFNGSNPNGADGDLKILEVTLEVVGSSGTNGVLDLNFSAMAAAGSFTNLLPLLTIANGPFRIIGSDCQLCGDVSDDGAANSTDALIVLSYDAGITLPPAILDKINAGCGDVNTDGTTNSTDALIILSYDAGIVVPFPVGNPGSCGGRVTSGLKIEDRRLKIEDRRSGVED